MKRKNNSHEVKIWFGADVSKGFFDVSFCLTEEIPKDISSMKKASFQSTDDGVKEFKIWASTQMEESRLLIDDKFGFVTEATGSYSVSLIGKVLQLCSNCIPVIADPKSTNAYKKSLRIRNKTDKIDAAVLSRYGAERKPSAYVPSSKEYMELKELIRQRRASVNMLTAAKVQAQEPSQVKAILMARKKVIRNLEKTIALLELAIKKHVNSYPNLKEQFNA